MDLASPVREGIFRKALLPSRTIRADNGMWSRIVMAMLPSR
jgi:hypothetical protein